MNEGSLDCLHSKKLKSVLVVEDDFISMALIDNMIKNSQKRVKFIDSDIKIWMAKNGNEALNILSEQKVDMIFK